MTVATKQNILYVNASSFDDKGKRVLVRDHLGYENWIYKEDGVSEADVALLGITSEDRRHIERFFGRTWLFIGA